jgi:predicted anti-sigma-YlaC factor YlaD
MTCEEIQDQLNDYVDGALPEAAFQEMELHLAGCAECRGEERLLRSLLAQAAALSDEKMPARDLWPQIVVRLDGGGAARPLWSRPTSWMGLAAAAVVTVALGTLVGRDDGRGTDAGTRPPVGRKISTGAPNFAAAEREYARATEELMAVIEARRGSLPPETQEALARNLQTIDEALQEIRAALEKEPSSPQLNHLLASTHRKKVDVLQRVVRLTRA